MNTFRIFLIASFLISLLAGFWAGTFIFQENTPKTLSQQPYTPSQSVSTTPGKQEGIWLIAVDRLSDTDTTPRIQNVWLITYITNYVKIKPLPVYPSDNPQHDLELIKTFKFTSNKQIAPAFWDFLAKHGQNVRDYIIFDEVAEAEVINFYGGVTIEGKYLNGLEALAQTPDSWNDPQASLKGQIAIMDSLCKNIFNTQPAPDLYKLQKKVGNHLLSNLDLDEKSKELQKQIIKGNHIICEFPDLSQKPQFSSKP
jgi:hypothetical protein